jgi:hypothetical protein
MLKCWSTVDIMKLFGFVYNSFDIGAFEECNLADDCFPFLLFFGEIVVSDMTNSFEAAWKMDIFGIIFIIYLCKPIELLLITKIFIVHDDLDLANFILFDLVSNSPQLCFADILS